MNFRYRLAIHAKLFAQQLNATTQSIAVCRAASITPIPKFSLQHRPLTQTIFAPRKITTARYFSTKTTNSESEVDKHAAQEEEGKDDGLGQKSKVANAGEELNVEKLRSDIDHKDKEIIDLKV